MHEQHLAVARRRGRPPRGRASPSRRASSLRHDLAPARAPRAALVARARSASRPRAPDPRCLAARAPAGAPRRRPRPDARRARPGAAFARFTTASSPDELVRVPRSACRACGARAARRRRDRVPSAADVAAEPFSARVRASSRERRALRRRERRRASRRGGRASRQVALAVERFQQRRARARVRRALERAQQTAAAARVVGVERRGLAREGARAGRRGRARRRAPSPSHCSSAEALRVVRERARARRGGARASRRTATRMSWRLSGSVPSRVPGSCARISLELRRAAAAQRLERRLRGASAAGAIPSARKSFGVSSLGCAPARSSSFTIAPSLRRLAFARARSRPRRTPPRRAGASMTATSSTVTSALTPSRVTSGAVPARAQLGDRARPGPRRWCVRRSARRLSGRPCRAARLLELEPRAVDRQLELPDAAALLGAAAQGDARARERARRWCRGRST